MATGRIRSTRKLKQWMVEQIDSAKYQGLVWDDNMKTMFRIPWKHAGKQDFRYDEDAAIFKAWAQFKGKFKDGDKIEPATWKTRLRCALNKSPEFEEVSERSQLDISEPYKVYRIVPPKEQRWGTPSGIKREKGKRKSSSSEEEEDEREERPSKIVMKDEPLKIDLADSVCDISSSTSTEDVVLDNSLVLSPSCKQDESSEVQENMKTETTSMVFKSDLSAMALTFCYGGMEVSKRTVNTRYCKICSSSPTSQSRNGLSSLAMEKIILPPADCVENPEKRKATEQLLQFLDRGIMLASNDNGIFIQRLCQGRVFWKGPCAPHQNQANKLDREKFVKLFDRNKFLEELELYRTADGPAPEYQITLCFGEELSDSEPLNNKLIAIQIEQLYARQLLDEAETSRASYNLCTNLTVESSGTDRFSTTVQDVSLNMYSLLELDDGKFEPIYCYKPIVFLEGQTLTG